MFQRLNGISLSDFKPAMLNAFVMAVSTTVSLPMSTISVTHLYGTGVKPTGQPSSSPTNKRVTRILSSHVDEIAYLNDIDTKIDIYRELKFSTVVTLKFDIEGLSQPNSVGLNYTISFPIERYGFTNLAVARSTILSKLNSSFATGSFNQLLQNSGTHKNLSVFTCFCIEGYVEVE